MYFLFVLFYVLFVCKHVLLPPGFNPIAVKYISYHIISYGIMNGGETSHYCTPTSLETASPKSLQRRQSAYTHCDSSECWWKEGKNKFPKQ